MYKCCLRNIWSIENYYFITAIFFTPTLPLLVCGITVSKYKKIQTKINKSLFINIEQAFNILLFLTNHFFAVNYLTLNKVQVYAKLRQQGAIWVSPNRIHRVNAVRIPQILFRRNIIFI